MLELDSSTPSPGADPYAAGTYEGGNYYNGGLFFVGEATSGVIETGFDYKDAIASWNASTPPGTWIEPESFARWFGEHGSEVPVDAATMDARPGGSWRAVMLLGPDSQKVFWGRFREVDEPSHLVLTITDQAEDVAETTHAVLTVDLEDLGDGRTRMTFTQSENLPPEQYEMTLRGWLLFTGGRTCSDSR